MTPYPLARLTWRIRERLALTLAPWLDSWYSHRAPGSGAERRMKDWQRRREWETR